MHKRIRTLILPCFCSGTLVAVIGNAFAECPKSTVYLSGTSGLAPDVVATEVSDQPTARVSYGRGTYASYDRNTRTVEARAEVWWDEGYNYYSRATVVEHFALKGLSATPVTLRLVLEGLSGTDSACRTATVGGSARLEAGGQIATAAVDCAGHLSVAFLEVTTFMTDAEPLEATYETAAEGYGNEPRYQLIGHLEFIGLPLGAEIVPCSTTLPVKNSTWGRVKALYR
jgi:hypothetical protein